MKTRLALLLLALAAALPAAQAQTGKWPERPVRVVEGGQGLQHQDRLTAVWFAASE